jgi:zinc/manganese transport system substrate-binding protein
MNMIIKTATVAAMTAAVLAGCGSSARGGSGQAAVSVVASTNVYGDLAAQVAGRLAGSRVKITSIIRGASADPHSYEANVRDGLAISRADLVIENGGGYDDFMDTLRRSAGGSATVVNVVRLSGKRPVDGELNEHVWYDLPTVGKLVDRIQDVLSRADSADRPTFAANAAALRRKLASLEQRESALRQRFAGAPVAITEPVPLYLLSACGLVNRTPAAFSRAVEDGTDVAPRVVRQTLDLFSAHRVRALVYNAQTEDDATSKAVGAAKAAHIPVVPVTETLPPDIDYPSWLGRLLDQLGAALETR